MQQGLAKYQSRRINTGNPITSSSPAATGRSSGMFNQVPAREEQRISLEKTVTTSSASHSSDAEVKPIERPKFSPERAAKVPQHMFELAKQYVEVFQEQGGKELNAAEKSALILEVAVFYSHPTRTGRLETLVTALSPKAC